MERNEFLLMCQRVSALEFKSVPMCDRVKFDGVVYFPCGYEMAFNKGVPQHTAILRDLNANTIIYANLERVEKIEQ